jgi:thiol-disulfide isomerase/thioredoxin
MSKVVEITSQAEYDALLKRRRVILFYGTNWCEGCTKVKPFYEALASKYSKRLTFAYADVEVNKLTKEFEQVPVFVGFRKGEVVNSFVGGERFSIKELAKEVIEAQ